MGRDTLVRARDVVTGYVEASELLGAPQRLALMGLLSALVPAEGAVNLCLVVRAMHAVGDSADEPPWPQWDAYTCGEPGCDCVDAVCCIALESAGDQ